jgi:D-xylose transport system ATP-binding protein
MAAPLIEARGITKRFPGVIALRDVTFDLQPGEIHALCGENGAGKSTLIKLLSGVHPHGSFEGELRVDGAPAQFRGIADAGRAGISVIHQELALVDPLSVAENLFLGVEPRRGPFVDWARLRARATELMERFELRLDPDLPLHSLGMGPRQLVEILRALGRDSRVLILDEPTAALTETEARVLHATLRDLRRRGVACIYISHRLGEVLDLADRITVLRDGATVGTMARAETTEQELIRRMVGRELADLFPAAPARVGAGPVGRLLEVKGLSVCPARGEAPFLRDVSLHVGPGEILGVGGLMGAGRTELVSHLSGAWGVRAGGTVELAGDFVHFADPEAAVGSGVCLVTEDRRRLGAIPEASIGFNLSLSSLREVARAGIIRSGEEAVRNRAMFDALGVRAPGLDSLISGLSGGNQQKVLLGRSLLARPRVLLLDEPTRGIDVGAKAEIYRIVRDLTTRGCGVILVSSELPELLGMSDRIVVLHAGRVSAEFTRAEATQERLLAAAMGHPGEVAA